MRQNVHRTFPVLFVIEDNARATHLAEALNHSPFSFVRCNSPELLKRLETGVIDEFGVVLDIAQRHGKELSKAATKNGAYTGYILAQEIRKHLAKTPILLLSKDPPEKLPDPKLGVMLLSAYTSSTFVPLKLARVLHASMRHH